MPTRKHKRTRGRRQKAGMWRRLSQRFSRSRVAPNIRAEPNGMGRMTLYPELTQARVAPR